MNDLTPFFSEEELERYNELKRKIEIEKEEKRKERELINKKKRHVREARYRKIHHERIQKSDRKYKKKRTQWYRDFKNKINTCSFCKNEFHICCIDLHHLKRFGEKERKLSDFDNITRIDEFIEEARKCAPLCAVCHRLITHKILDDGIIDNESFNKELDNLEAIKEELKRQAGVLDC